MNVSTSVILGAVIIAVGQTAGHWVGAVVAPYQLGAVGSEASVVRIDRTTGEVEGLFFYPSDREGIRYVPLGEVREKQRERERETSSVGQQLFVPATPTASQPSGGLWRKDPDDPSKWITSEEYRRRQSGGVTP